VKKKDIIVRVTYSHPYITAVYVYCVTLAPSVLHGEGVPE